MTKFEKQVLAEALKQQLADADKKWETEGPMAAAYCYGYLIGTVKAVINQLEN